MSRYAVLALLILVAGCGKDQAVFQGKSTSEWVKQLRGANLAARLEAAKALGNVGQEGVAALIGALQDSSAEIRGAAADALGVIGPEAKHAVPYLPNALKNSKTSTPP